MPKPKIKIQPKPPSESYQIISLRLPEKIVAEFDQVAKILAYNRTELIQLAMNKLRENGNFVIDNKDHTWNELLDIAPNNKEG